MRLRAARWMRQLMAPRVLMVAIVAMVGGAGFYYASQRWMVSRLVAKLQQVDDRQAPEIVRELARFDQRAYIHLVSAADSPRSAVALAARRQIDRCVEAWEREVFLHPSTFDLSTTAIPLAQAFEQQAKGMSPSGADWARSVLESLAAMAQAQTLRHKLALLTSCDAALAALPQGDLRTTLADADRGNYDLMLGHVLHSRRPMEPSLAPQNITAASTPAEEPPPRVAAESTPPAMAPEEPWRSTLPDRSNLGMSSSGEPLQQERSSVVAATPPPLPVPDPQILPHPHTAPEALPAGTARGAQRAVRPQPDRDLFESLSGGTADEQTSAADKLYSLGYGQVAPHDARLLLSPSIDDRQALVESVLSSRRLEAGKWLRLLLRDPAPQVRATVVAGISTTDNEALLQEALDVAVRDSDPRVADQAELLRNRLR